MFQRLKGAIDSRIAEEQARQRAAAQQNPPSRSASTRSSARASSPSKRPRRSNSTSKNIPSRKGPDPSKFDPEFVVGDESEVSRTATPLSSADKDNPGTSSPEKGAVEGEKSHNDGNESQDEEGRASELPMEVRVKLRKLEKLESKYSELLRSYRIAHARVSAIDLFEAALREHTPLSSVADPPAFVEYLNQLNTKGDMVLQELKRVSSERDDLKNKLEESQRSTLAAQAQNTELQSEIDSLTAKQATTGNGVKASTALENETSEEEFFSYDSELPRVREELHQKESRIDELEQENSDLKTELSSTKESAERLMQNLESATLDLQSLQDLKQRAEADLLKESATLTAAADTLKEKLEQTKRSLQSERDAHQSQLAATEEQRDSLSKQLQDSVAKASDRDDAHEIEDQLRSQISELENELVARRESAMKHEQRTETLNGLLGNLRHQISSTEKERDAVQHELENLRSERAEDRDEPKGGSQSARKKNKKKKKGSSPAAAQNEIPSGPISSSTLSVPSQATLEEMEQKLKQSEKDVDEKRALIVTLEGRVAEKEASITTLQKKLKDQDDLKEEIETLRDELVNVGQEHVEAADKVKGLINERSFLQEQLDKLQKEVVEIRTNSIASATLASTRAQELLTSNYDELKRKADALQTDLSLAQQLAASRFKDLADMREMLQKAQPELTSLRKEVSGLKESNKDLESRTADIRRLETKEKDLRSEVSLLKSQVSEKDSNIKSLNDQIKKEANRRTVLEELHRKTQRDLQGAEHEKSDAIEAKHKLTNDLARTSEELKNSRAKLLTLEEQINQLQIDAGSLRDELQLKNAQYASAQSLMNSMQDQTQEMGTQMKEVRARCESLEEELADAHRLLNERSREGETMRRLLSEAQGRADTRVKEMQERLELAIEERERAEEQANTLTRRRGRETEELRQKIRDAEKALSRAVEAKEDIESTERALRRQNEDLEQKAARASEEVADVRQAMSQLRGALDEGEKQARELDKEKSDLRRALEECQARLESVQKSSKTLSEELKGLKTSSRIADSQSSRSSIDSSRVVSPAGKGRVSANTTLDTPGTKQTPDFVYLKNVLLQFLEQKDKKTQLQLLPVLSMLLHFDRKDEQKWMSAISTR